MGLGRHCDSFLPNGSLTRGCRTVADGSWLTTGRNASGCWCCCCRCWKLFMVPPAAAGVAPRLAATAGGCVPPLPALGLALVVRDQMLRSLLDSLPDRRRCSHPHAGALEHKGVGCLRDELRYHVASEVHLRRCLVRQQADDQRLHDGPRLRWLRRRGHLSDGLRQHLQRTTGREAGEVSDTGAAKGGSEPSLEQGRQMAALTGQSPACQLTRVGNARGRWRDLWRCRCRS